MDGRQCRHCHPIPPKIPVGSGGRSSVAPPPGLAKHVTQLVHWGQHQQRTAVIPPGVVIVDVRVKLVPHCVAYPSPPSLECYPFIPVSVVTIGDRLHRDTPPPHPCPTADCCFYPLSLPSSPLDPPPSTSRRGLHLNLCCRHSGLILPGRQLHHVDCYVALSQAHDDVNLLQPSSTSKPPLPPPFPMDWMCIPGSGCSSGGGAILLIVLVLKAAACPPAFNAHIDGWLLCAHSVVHHPHPHCLCPTPFRRCCPRARLCPVRTTTTADPPPEVGEDRPLDAPDNNARSPSHPPHVNRCPHQRCRMPPLPRVTSLAEGEDKGHDLSPSISS